MALGTISATQALICYDGGVNGETQVLDISGDTITGNPVFNFRTASVSFIELEMISSTKVLSIYTIDSLGNRAASQLLDISGTGVTGNDEFTFDGADCVLKSVGLLDNKTAVVAYEDVDFTRSMARILNLDL